MATLAPSQHSARSRLSGSCSSTTTRSCGRGCARSWSARTTCGWSARRRHAGRGGGGRRRGAARSRAARPQADRGSADTRASTSAAELTAAHPGLGVLVLTTFLDDQLVVEAVQAGARGYVVKDVDTTELVRAIRAVSPRGERVRRPQRVGDGARRSTRRRAGATEQLTARELEVLRLLARGLSNRAIGGAAVTSPRPP